MQPSNNGLSSVDLLNRVEATYEIFTKILRDGDVYHAMHGEQRKQLITGVNKAYGQAMGFLHEYALTQSQRDKGRQIITQTHADVTTGQADDFFAKSSECKSVTAPSSGDVDTQLRKAIYQLGGSTGHTPRQDDVRVIDVKIEGLFNPWPLSGGTYGVARNPQTIQAIASAAVAKINGLLERYEAVNVRTWLNGETQTKNAVLRQISAFPSSTRPLSIQQGLMGPIVTRIRCLTIKVRYDLLYTLNTGETSAYGETTGLKEIVLQVYRKNPSINPPQLVTEIVKTKREVHNFMNNQIKHQERTFY